MSTTFLTLLRGIALAVPILLLAAIAITAQTERKFAQAQQENAAALRNYQWKSRTEIMKGGDSKKTQLSLVRYDANGSLQKTLISSTPDEDVPSRGLIGHIAQKKKKDFLAMLEQLGQLARSYGEIPPEKMQQFMATASFVPVSGQQNLIRIEGRDVLQAGDSMTVFVDPMSRRQRRIEIQTALDGKTVRIVSQFQDLAQGGPTYMSRSEVHYDGTAIAIITENFDYARVQMK